MFEDFLVTVYPEFKASDNYNFAVSDSHRSDHERYYSLRLITYHRPEAEQRVPINKSHNHSRQAPCAPDPWTEGEEVMQSSITYSESFHRILGFTNISDYANGKKLLDAEEEVRRHLQWTNEQIADYLRTLGAKYGPWNKDELVKKIPLDQLTPFLGKLTLVSVQFVNVVPQGNVGGGPHAILLWKAVVSTHDPQVGEIQFALHFEPFEGKLHSIVPIQRTAH